LIRLTTSDDELLKDIEVFLAVKGFIRSYRVFDYVHRIWTTVFVRKK